MYPVVNILVFYGKFFYSKGWQLLMSKFRQGLLDLFL